jgi:hypothetical protein
MGKFRRILTKVLLLLGLAAPLVAASFGNLGETLEQAKQTDFFRFFHLEQSQVKKNAGSIVTAFKPSGKKFRPLVTVKVTTDGAGRILALEMAMARSFIDSPRDGIFARDIAKSFLQAGLPAPRDGETTDLINEIELQGTSTMTLIEGPRNKPKLPEKPTPGYLAYLGEQPSYEHRLGDYLLRLVNETEGAAPVLVFSIQHQ